MAELTPRARRILLALGGLYALVNAFIGVHSGGDLVIEMALTERLLHGLPTSIQVVKNLLAKRTAGAGDQRTAESWKDRHCCHNAHGVSPN